MLNACAITQTEAHMNHPDLTHVWGVKTHAQEAAQVAHKKWSAVNGNIKPRLLLFSSSDSDGGQTWLRVRANVMSSCHTRHHVTRHGIISRHVIISRHLTSWHHLTSQLDRCAQSQTSFQATPCWCRGLIRRRRQFRQGHRDQAAGNLSPCALLHLANTVELGKITDDCYDSKMLMIPTQKSCMQTSTHVSTTYVANRICCIHLQQAAGALSRCKRRDMTHV